MWRSFTLRVGCVSCSQSQTRSDFPPACNKKKTTLGGANNSISTLLESAHGGQADMLSNEPRVSSLAPNAKDLLFISAAHIYKWTGCIKHNEFRISLFLFFYQGMTFTALQFGLMLNEGGVIHTWRACIKMLHTNNSKILVSGVGQYVLNTPTTTTKIRTITIYEGG